MIISKAVWDGQGGKRKQDVSWRFSLEDPFERADSIRGRDLGRTIASQHNQDTIFMKLKAINHHLQLAMCFDNQSYNSLTGMLGLGLGQGLVC
jgi:hypothetical protein